MPQDDSPDSVSYNLPAFEMPTTSSPDHGGTRFTNASIPLCSSANTASSDSLRRGREYSFSRSAVESTDGILTPTTGDSHSESSHLPPSVNGDRIDEVTDYKDTITPNTHTTTFTDSSIPTIETFATDLQSAIDSAWPIPASTRIRARHQYKAVHVMLLSWEDGNPGIWGEMKRLEHTFSELYHFEVEECRIPNRDPGKALMGRVERFVERGDGEGKLLIVCYAGAVGMGRLGEGALWTANYLTDSPRVASAGVQKMFEEATADALMLFDSPFSPDPISQEGQGVTEVLAACGIESHSPLVGPDSFTSSLIKELEEAFTGSPISVAELHGRMTSSARDRKPELLRNTHGTLVPDENGQLIYAPSMKRTPVHSFLTDGVRRRSIVLTPQPVRGIRNTMSFPKAGRRTDTWAEWSCDTQSQSAKPTWPSKYPIAKPIANATQHPRVLLSVRIEENYFPSTDDNADSVWKWCEWLRDIPSGLDPVAVEAVYRSSSTSTLLIVNLPFLVWDMLPENEAYSFIGFVDSKNLQDVVGEPHVPVAVPVPDAQSKSERKRDEREIEREVSKRVEAQMAARELVSLRKEKEEWVRKAEREREAALARPHSLDKPRDGREEVVKAKAPIRFKDAVGRKLCFPFHMASTWMGVEELIKQAFLHVDVIGPHVMEGHYDLVCSSGDLSGEIILPQVWETLVEPGWQVSMHMWPLPQLPKTVPTSIPPPPPRHPMAAPRGANPRPYANGPPPPPPPQQFNGQCLPPRQTVHLPGAGNGSRGGPPPLPPPPPTFPKAQSGSGRSWFAPPPPPPPPPGTTSKAIDRNPIPCTAIPDMSADEVKVYEKVTSGISKRSFSSGYYSGDTESERSVDDQAKAMELFNLMIKEKRVFAVGKVGSLGRNLVEVRFRSKGMQMLNEYGRKLFEEVRKPKEEEDGKRQDEAVEEEGIVDD